MIKSITQKQHDIENNLAIMGSIVLLSLFSKLHSKYSIGYLASRIKPSLQSNSFRYYYDEAKQPIGFVCWTFLSDAVLKEVLATGRDILQHEYNSGDNIFFTEILAPFGHIGVIYKDLKEKVFCDLKQEYHGYAIRGFIKDKDVEVKPKSFHFRLKRRS